MKTYEDSSNLKFVIVMSPKNYDGEINNWLQPYLISIDNKGKTTKVPTKHPPPVDVFGPYAPGDKRGITYMAKTKEDCDAFVLHMTESDLVEEFWIKELK